MALAITSAVSRMLISILSMLQMLQSCVNGDAELKEHATVALTLSAF
jgi:hypothetical protein